LNIYKTIINPAENTVLISKDDPERAIEDLGAVLRQVLDDK
jgi:hypothetical protein